MVDEDKFSFPHVAITQGLLTAEQFRHCREKQEEILQKGKKPGKIFVSRVVRNTGQRYSVSGRTVCS